MTEMEFLEVIEAACLHPGLYTPTGSFFETVSFLEGYGVGGGVGGGSYHSVFTPFLKWVTREFDVNEVIIDWPTFRRRFSTDSDAFANLQLLYDKYLRMADESS